MPALALLITSNDTPDTASATPTVKLPLRPEMFLLLLIVYFESDCPQQTMTLKPESPEQLKASLEGGIYAVVLRVHLAVLSALHHDFRQCREFQGGRTPQKNPTPAASFKSRLGFCEVDLQAKAFFGEGDILSHTEAGSYGSMLMGGLGGRRRQPRCICG